MHTSKHNETNSNTLPFNINFIFEKFISSVHGKQIWVSRDIGRMKRKKVIERVDGRGMCHKIDAQTNRMRHSIRIYS